MRLICECDWEPVSHFFFPNPASKNIGESIRAFTQKRQHLGGNVLFSRPELPIWWEVVLVLSAFEMTGASATERRQRRKGGDDGKMHSAERFATSLGVQEMESDLASIRRRRHPSVTP